MPHIPIHSRDIAMAIIMSEEWKKALRNTTFCYIHGSTTPLREFIRRMPGKLVETDRLVLIMQLLLFRPC